MNKKFLFSIFFLLIGVFFLGYLTKILTISAENIFPNPGHALSEIEDGENLATKQYVKDYVDEKIAQVVLGGQKLVNANHSQNDCLFLKGEVVEDTSSNAFCRFDAAVCPSGWNQYLNYNTTAAQEIAWSGVSEVSYPCSCHINAKDWSNVPSFVCSTGYQCKNSITFKTPCCSCAGSGIGGHATECHPGSAPIIQIGCY